MSKSINGIHILYNIYGLTRIFSSIARLCFQKCQNCLAMKNILLWIPGGVSSPVTLTAYVVISLLEADLVPFDPRIESAAKCIKQSLDDVTDSYSLSIISYMFAKMKKTEDYKMVMNKLNDMAIDEGTWTSGIIFL